MDRLKSRQIATKKSPQLETFPKVLVTTCKKTYTFYRK